MNIYDEDDSEKFVEFDNNETLVIKEAIWRQLPGKASHLSNIAQKMRDQKAEEKTQAFAEFITIHEEIGHLLRVYERALNALGIDTNVVEWRTCPFCEEGFGIAVIHEHKESCPARYGR